MMLPLERAAAQELLVGPAQVKLPIEAAAVAVNDDIIRIDPAIYMDCATRNASRLVVEATGPGVLIAGKICAGKGIFISEGSNITIRGIPFPTRRLSRTTARAFAQLATI